jgi:hypothetical protein
MNAEEATPARAAAGRPRQDGGASADFRVRVGGGNFCFENLIKVACWKRHNVCHGRSPSSQHTDAEGISSARKEVRSHDDY